MAELRVREVVSGEDLARVLALRSAVFRGGASDRDAEDARSRHLLVEAASGGPALATLRFRAMPAAAVGDSYSGRRYDLGRLVRCGGTMVEIGRFCARRAGLRADVVMALWAALLRQVRAERAALLFGCTALHGTDPAPHARVLAGLARHPLPAALAVAPRGTDRVALPPAAAAPVPLPPPLNVYLRFGARFGDSALIDRDLGTIHVFTALEMQAIPLRQAERLRRIALTLD